MEDNGLQFYHMNKNVERKDRHTFCVCMTEELKKSIQGALLAYTLGYQPKVINLEFGATKVHKNDNYCKAEGRELAQIYLDTEEAELVGFDSEIRDDKPGHPIFVFLRSKEFVFKLKYNANKQVPYLYEVWKVN